MSKTGILILAAGNSSRLGRPKQLLLFRGKTLLSHVISEALAAALRPVVVVTGAYRTEIEEALRGLDILLVHNPDWETGMASGIVAGLGRALGMDPRLEAVIVAVCDQPYIAAGVLAALEKEAAASGKGLIGCAYSGIIGTPVFFERRYFTELSALSGNEGAKQLLKRYPDDVATVPFPKGGVDIDTEGDLGYLR